MEINRRQFLAITTATAALTAFERVAGADSLDVQTAPNPANAIMPNVTAATSPGATSAALFDAGPAAQYAADGVYSQFRQQGFFLIRKDGQLVAVSAACTHRKVALTPRADCTLYCRRHGSIFSADGHVMKGPAKRDLPALATNVDPATGHLLVTLPAV